MIAQYKKFYIQLRVFVLQLIIFKVVEYVLGKNHYILNMYFKNMAILKWDGGQRKIILNLLKKELRDNF